MNQKDIQDAYVEGAQELIPDWESKTPPQRKVSAVSLVNTILAGELPQLKPLRAGADKSQAVFDPDEWGVAFNDDLLTSNEVPNRPSLRADDMRVNNPRFVLSALYHEARHSEQRFLAARFLAATSPHPSATKIARNLQMPPEIAEAAIREASSLIADRHLFGFAKWLYVGGFTKRKVAEKKAHKCELEDAEEAVHREQRYIEVAAKEWYGRGIAGSYRNDGHISLDERRATELYKLAQRAYFRAYDAYAKEIKEEDARITSYRVAALLGVGGNRLMELLGKRGAMD